MQPYYAIKLKCFVLRLMMGCSLLLISAGIVVSILQEVMNSYDANSRLAYILGLLICALMACVGICAGFIRLFILKDSFLDEVSEVMIC